MQIKSTYQLIKAEERHLEQAASLMLLTGYWGAGLKHNNLNIPSKLFMSKYVAPLYLPFMIVAVEKSNHDKVLGVIVAGLSHKLNSIQYSEEAIIDPVVMIHFENLTNFQIPNRNHVSFLAVNKLYRKQGIGHALLTYAEILAKNSDFETLSLYTLNYQTSSVQLYLNFGMMLREVIVLSKALPAHYVLYFEKNKTLEALSDYFETDAYQNLNLLNLGK